MRNLAQAHPKPIMIAEATPRIDINAGNAQEHWTNWYAPLFANIYANDNIKALACINADWESQPMWQGQGWGDYCTRMLPKAAAIRWTPATGQIRSF